MIKVVNRDALSLNGIDIDTTQIPEDNQALAYDSLTGKYVPTTFSSGEEGITHNDTINIQGGEPDSYYHSNQEINTDSSPHFSGGTIGDETNYSEFESDGTLVFKGDATVYNDLILPVLNLRPGGTPPIFAQFQNGVYGFRFDNNVIDEVHGTVELQHDYMEGTELEIHAHWSPTTTNTGDCRFGFEYTIAPMGSGVFGETSTLTKEQAGSGVVNIHQYISIGVISGSGLGIGTIIAFRFFRDGTDDLDTFTGNAFVHQVGIHYQCDTVGSRQRGVK